MFKMLIKIIKIKTHKDMSEHRKYTSYYEDLCQ